MPATTLWPSQGQDRARDELYHAVGPPGGPFKLYLLGNFSRGRIHQTVDGRIHYLMTRGQWFDFELWYARGDEDRPDRISQPIRLNTPTNIDHVFVNSTRAGGVPDQFVDCYWTGPYPGHTNKIYYGRVK